jgi:hypothetical protein
MKPMRAAREEEKKKTSFLFADPSPAASLGLADARAHVFERSEYCPCAKTASVKQDSRR